MRSWINRSLIVLMVASCTVAALRFHGDSRRTGKERPRQALSLAYMMRQDYTNSLATDMDAILHLENPHHEFFQRAGTALMKLQRWDDAHDMFGLAIQTADTSQSWQNMGASYLQRWLEADDTDKQVQWLWSAQGAYLESLKSERMNAWALDGFSDAVFYADEAGPLRNDLLSVDRPLEYEEVYMLAKWSLNAGQFSLAHQFFDIAQRIKGERVSIPLHFYDGYVLYGLGQFRDAAAEYTLALRIDPGMKEVQQSLEQAQYMEARP